MSEKMREALLRAVAMVESDVIQVRPSERDDLMQWLTQANAALDEQPDQEKYSTFANVEYSVETHTASKQPAQGEAVAFLANGARFKLAALPRSAAFMSFPAELAGKWVALVDATDDRHLLLKATAAPSVPDELKAAIEWAVGVCHDEGWDRTDAEKKHLAALKRVYLAASPEVKRG